MLRRHLIAWAISGTSVVGTGGLTVLTVAIPAPRQPSPAPSLPPVTVYDDRYIDDVVAATPPAGPVELAAVEDPGVIPDVPPVSTPVAQSVVASAAPPTAARRHRHLRPGRESRSDPGRQALRRTRRRTPLASRPRRR